MRAVGAASAIVNISDYRSNGKKRCRINRKNNSIDPKAAKLFEKFRRLGYEQQRYLLSFAKGYVLDTLGEANVYTMEQEFRFIMEIGMSKYSHALKNIDREADELLEGKH